MTQKNLELKDISALDLTELCTRIADAYDADASSINGDVFAYLAKRLIAAETQPGGPYNDESGKSTICLNAAIGRVFLRMGHPLPRVDAYLNKAGTVLTGDEREALRRYKAVHSGVASKKAKTLERHASYSLAAKTLAAIDEPARTQAIQFLARIEAADTTHEIAAISQFTAHAFKDARISSNKLRTLGEANVHSWIAYSIYDHILDKEADATLLPAANICMRLALTHYRQVLPARHPMQATIAQYFDKVDAISAWEINACRFTVSDGSINIRILPDYQYYEMLAWRSCIHILGPLIVASFAPSLSGKAIEHLTAGLHHYLIARQLSDDIHDWREDLTAGRISAVVSLLLGRQKVQQGSAHELHTLISTIQEDFLGRGAMQISELILRHTKHALRELGAAGCDPSSELVTLVLRLERMANEAIGHQQRFATFKDRYTASAGNLTRS